MPSLNRITVGKLSKILLIIFACLIIVSALSIYHTHQLPTYENRTITLCTYKHTGTYSYVAALKPNIIYYNKTTLSPEEGILYTAIVEYINITFTYYFTCNPQPENVAINHKNEFEVESPGRWLRRLTEIEAKELLQLSGGLNFSIKIDCKKLRQFVEAINREIYGTAYSATYNVNIKPRIHVTAKLATKSIDEIFTPELKVAFKTDAEKGSYIAIENLNQENSGRITETQQFPLQNVQNQRTASIIATATTATAFIISAFLYIKYKPPITQAKIIEKLTEPHKDLIVKTTQKPPETQITVKIETLEDLVKIAEILARPILHIAEGKEHIFYIIDNNVRYEYVIEEAEQVQAKPEAAKPVEEAKRAVRLECPYLDKRGGKCGKLAFGRSMEEAYSRLERHVAKDHPDRLEEFKKTYGGR
jgi:hypothetical protein